MSKRRNVAPWLVGIGIVWGIIILRLTTSADPTPHNRAMADSILLSGMLTLAWVLTDRFWLPLCRRAPMSFAILVGILNAAIVEIIFLVVGSQLGAPEIAASPNIFLDLVITLPWYIGMVWLFARAHSRARFPFWAVLVLGGLYEVGADGVIGGILAPALTGGASTWQQTLVCLPTVAFWQFITVYSSMVIPAAMILNNQPAPAPIKPVSRWRLAASPLLWLVPYFVYLIILLAVISAG
jgi:hypothetical protein